jgi:hypothetical protein
MVKYDYFLEHHSSVGLINGEALGFLWGKNWISKYYLDELQLQRLKRYIL